MVSVDIEHRIRGSLDKLVDDFFSSVEGDDSKITTFLTSWSILDATVRQHSHELQQNTLNSVLSLATTVSAIASSILDLQDTGNRIRDELDTDIVKILNDDLDHLSISGIQESEQIASKAGLPAYIEASHSWLLANLHNPYPPNQTKNLISQRTNTPVKNIDAWFVDVRRRIGWNTIRKRRFSSRAEMIDAALIFFHNCDATPGKRPRPDCHIDFVTMRNRALALYEHHTDSMPSESRVKKRTSSPKQIKRKRSPISASQIRCAYPSPVSSRSGSPQISSQSLPSTPVVSNPVCAKKRSITPADEPSIPSKRQRVEIPTDIIEHVPHLPSPASSIRLLDNSDGSPLLSSSNLPLQNTGKRKRDSSDHDEPIPKRLHSSSNVGLENPASGSISMEGFISSSNPEPYDFMMSLPLPVTAPNLDDATPVDITVHRYSFSPPLGSKELFSTDCSAPPFSFNIAHDFPFFDSNDKFGSDHLFANFGCLDTLGLDFAPAQLKTPVFAIQSEASLSLPVETPEFAIVPSQLDMFTLYTDQNFFQSYHLSDHSHILTECDNIIRGSLDVNTAFKCHQDGPLRLEVDFAS